MKILVTGTAGFIGHALVKALAHGHHDIVGIDNINTYYDTALKLGRLSDTGISPEAIEPLKPVQSTKIEGYRFVQMDLADRASLDQLFAEEQFTHVCNLAGQAGVRYSIDHPHTYIESNVMGFLNILEACRHHGVQHLVYASSSSIYGENPHAPFDETDRTDEPVSLYAATKKSNELMAYAYAKLYGLRTTALRFFTVYGPWGRPDMAPFKFLERMLRDEPIQVYNYGHCQRDFTYIDDIVEGVRRVIEQPGPADSSYHIYNVGCSQPVELMHFIATLERITGREAQKEMVAAQPGDVTRTYADTSRLEADYGYHPNTPLEVGLKQFYEWYKEFYK